MTTGYQTVEFPTVAAMMSRDTLNYISSVKLWSIIAFRTLGLATVGDGGGAHYYWDPTSTATHDGVMVVQIAYGTATPVVSGRIVRVTDGGPVQAIWFGYKADCKSSILLTRTANSNIIRAAAGTFTQADVGKYLEVANATAILTGTVSTTTGVGTITGLGTQFLTELADSTHVWVDGFQVYQIGKIDSNTSLTMGLGQVGVSNTAGKSIEGDSVVVSRIVSVALDGSSCTVAAAGATFHKTQSNVRGNWGTDNGPILAAAAAATPQGVDILLPSGEAMFPNGYTATVAHAYIGAGAQDFLGHERGNVDLMQVSLSHGTTVRLPGANGWVFDPGVGNLMLGGGLRSMNVIGSGHFNATGVQFGGAGLCGTPIMNDVVITNFKVCWNLFGVLEAYFYNIRLLAAQTGVANRGGFECNDVHVWGMTTQFMEIGIDTDQMASVHFHGPLIQNNRVGVNWGRLSTVFVYAAWFENNIQSQTINSLGTGSSINFGLIDCHGGDACVMPVPVITSAGVQGFTIQNSHLDGLTLNLTGLGGVSIKKSRLGDIDMTAPPVGMVLESVTLAVNGFGETTAAAPPLNLWMYTYAATVTPTWKRGDSCYVLATGNVIFAPPTNAPDNATMTLTVQQDGVGGRTVTLDAVYKGTWTAHAGANAVASMTFRKISPVAWIPTGGLP